MARLPGPPGRNPEATRRAIVEAAFAEFFANGYQAGSLNHIVAEAGTTKGALFHHFASKQELGYAVVDDIVGPLVSARWLDPLLDSTDPLTDLQLAFRRSVEDDIVTGFWLQGCPLNNAAQEMSPLDAGLQQRIARLYETWRTRCAELLALGIERGTVRRSVDPRRAAAFVVASQLGIWGIGKGTRDAEVMRQALEGLCDYLDSLRP
jgi:TetR/AcrR family transcriptional regulator, transcriptional repressor for nem operon